MMSAEQARLQLAVIQAEGDACQKQYQQRVEAMNKAEMSIVLLKNRIAGIDQRTAELRQWQRGAAESFVPASALTDWQVQLDQHAAARMLLCQEILVLQSVTGQHRMAALKAAQAIDALHRQQRNLSELAAGRNPGAGWQGSVTYI